ncbi:RidA family protein [Kribbella antibiotica]|uniref:RidA family protein n=1 Tax=Kribbella antibiotica TaxID=190195 RepID=A0A4R4ZHL2_9ACTN|nr:RidA family protein [Kribbella antibiotica]TDD58053.1 RidA family protein [Kribbella antibiotica]
MPRVTLQPAELFASKAWGFSQVAVSPPGTIINIAGQVAWGADEKSNAEGLEEQLRQALDHVFVAVRAAGGQPDDIQILRLYIRDFQSGTDADRIGKVLTDVFGTDNPPPSSWIGVQALAQPEYLVEVEAMAVVS